MYRVKTYLEKEIDLYKFEIDKEQKILDKLDPIETCDDKIYELKIQLIALEKLQEKSK